MQQQYIKNASNPLQNLRTSYMAHKITLNVQIFTEYLGTQRVPMLEAAVS
jgi:hypothetical protein